MRQKFDILKVVNEEQLIIDASDGSLINVGQPVNIVRLGEEVIHPETKHSLGRIENVIAFGYVAHSQDRFTIVTNTPPRTASSDIIGGPRIFITKRPSSFSDIEPMKDIAITY